MKKAEEALPNELLSYEREQHHWSQEEVAEQIGAADRNMVGRWERGVTQPTPHYRQKLVALFGKSARELGLVRQGETAFWSVPYRQNVFFTGREALLTQVHASFSQQGRAAPIPPQALTGLGGVGKTQSALEYAYRYRDAYHLVAWIRADSPGALASDFAALAALVNLPQQHEQDQHQTIKAVQAWLAVITRWLLIFDNVDDLNLLDAFLPSPVRGHILLTTRTQATGTLATARDIAAMGPEEGACLLLRRAKIIDLHTAPEAAAETDRAQASALSQALGGLPLALDQAGAYIEETRCGLSNYLRRFEAHRAELLRWRGDLVSDHPEPVATTWSLSFERIGQMNPAAHALLCFCALLAPDAIPEEMLLAESTEKETPLAPLPGDPLQLDRAIKDLGKFSLLHRRPGVHMLTIHRLVQGVLVDTMDDETQRFWAERVVRVVENTFPDVDVDTWQQCERLLPQARIAIEHLTRWQMRFPAVTRLLHRVGSYLVQRSQHEQAEQLFKLALTLREETVGPSNPLIAESLTDLGLLYFFQTKYVQAESLMQRALAIRERALGGEDARVAESLDNLALMYSVQQKYAEAEPLYQQALQLRERLLGVDHTDVAETLGNLGVLYLKQGQLPLAESLLERARAIREKHLGADHPYIGAILLNLAAVYREQQRYAQAESLLLKVMSVWEQALGPDDSDVAYVLSNLARLYFAQRDYARAEPLYQRARTIFEKIYGPHDPRAIERLKDLARVYGAVGEYERAEQYYQQAITTLEQLHGAESFKVAEVVSELAHLYEAQNNKT